jgi:hypothetical protein
MMPELDDHPARRGPVNGGARQPERGSAHAERDRLIAEGRAALAELRAFYAAEPQSHPTHTSGWSAGSAQHRAAVDRFIGVLRNLRTLENDMGG